MLDSKILVRTLCCRLLSVRLNQKVVDDISVVGFVLTLDVGFEKVNDLLVISISGVEENSQDRREIFSPSLISFSTSSSLKTDLTYIPVLPGSYRVNVGLSGPSSSNYKVVFPDGDVLTVKGVEEALSPPLIQRSEFSSDGSKVKVIFTSPTNRGGVVNILPCGVLFPPIFSSQCVWTSDSSLEISPIGSYLPLNVEDVLRIKEGVLKARCTSVLDPSCSSWRSNDPQNSTISAPSRVITPMVTLWIASEIGSCDDLIVDLSSSSGSGGRLWKSVSFLVRGSDPNLHLIQEFLFTNVSINPPSVRTPFLIPNRLLSPGYAYSLEVKLCNFLNSCGSTVKSFVMSSSPGVPVVFLNSQNKMSIFRNATLFISGDGYTSNCEGSKSRSYLSYSWTLFENGVLQSSPELQSESVNSREFMLPSYRLVVGSLYSVKLTVRHLKSLKDSSSSVGVLVSSGDLICVSVGSDRIGLRLDGSVLLDLSGSYDSNLHPRDSIDSNSELHFELNCFRISPSYLEDCHSLNFTQLTSSHSQVAVAVNSSSSSVSVSAGHVFKIVMTGRLSSSGADDNRRCQKVIELSILDPLSPLLTLEALSGSKINPSSKLKILASVSMVSSGNLSWTVNDDSIDLSVASLSPIFRSLPSSLSNSPYVLSLVVAGNSLPQQSSFTFTLTCSLVNGYSSSSSVTIATNSPPFGGVLEVNPPQGVMLETLFSMFALGWVDEDLPLSYQFGYLSLSSSLTESYSNMIILRSKIELSSTATLLPSGSRSSSSLIPNSYSNLSCAVLVFDELDSPSSSLYNVAIKEVEMSVDDLRTFLLAGINTSNLTSNPEDLKNTLSSTSTLLNRVDCSNAPDCDSLNRKQCSWIIGTCGACLSGFVGLLGPSNTFCFSSNYVHHRALTSVMSSSSPICESDANCSDFGLFLECNPQTNLCQSIQQSCPNSCSGHGRCAFVSKYDPAVSVLECGLLDLDCVPHCVCDEGYVGSSCSLVGEEMSKEMDLRQLLVESLGDLMSSENPLRTNVKSWVNTLSSIASDPLSLGDESKNSMTSLVIDILHISREAGVSSEELAEVGLDQVIEMCVSGFSSSSFQSDEQTLLLSSLLRAYGDFVTSDMSEAQNPVSSTTPSFRSSSFYLSLSSFLNSSVSLSIPETQLESVINTNSFVRSQQQSIELTSGIQYPLQISISETLTHPSLNQTIVPDTVNITESPLSVPVFVSFKSNPCVRNDAGSGDCLMKVILSNKLKPIYAPNSYAPNSGSILTNDIPPLSSPQPSSETNHTYFTVDCVERLVEDHLFVCPSNDVITISCNGSVSGRFHRYCPVHSTEVRCQTTVHTLSQDISCELSEHNESMTICQCNLSNVEVIGDDSPVSFSIMSMEKSVSKEFISTWESASKLSSGKVLDSWVVLLTVGGLGVSFMLFIFGGIQYDSYEKRILLFGRGEMHQSTCDQPVKKSTWFFVGVSPSDAPVPSISANAHNPSDGVVANDDLKLIDDSLPSIFKSDSLWCKFKEEMRVYHRWLGIVFYYSPEFPRAMRVLSLFSSIVIMLFIQSMTYNIADPDDGSCEACEDESCCLSLKSTLNSNEYRCYWERSYSVEEGGSCLFREIGEDMTRMFIVALISTIVSTPLALSIQYMIANVLSKEALYLGEAERERQQSYLKRIQKLLSSRKTLMPGSQVATTTPDLTESSGRCLQEDLNNFLKELSEYYKWMLVEKTNEVEEFRGG
jgi:hypothetical protein